MYMDRDAARAGQEGGDVMTDTPIHQTEYLEPCPHCGSTYRRGILCSACGGQCPPERVYVPVRYVPRGRAKKQWEKK